MTLDTAATIGLLAEALKHSDHADDCAAWQIKGNWWVDANDAACDCWRAKAAALIEAGRRNAE